MNAYVYGLSVGCKGDFVLAGTSKCNEVKLFDRSAGDWKTMTTVTGIKNPIFCVDFAKGVRKFAFGGGDGQLYIVNVLNNDQYKPKPKTKSTILQDKEKEN